MDEKDILQTEELKHMPYSVSDGYFHSLKVELKTYSYPQKVTANLRLMILRPALAMAAILALILTVGILFSSKPLSEEEFTQEDMIVFSGGMTNTILYEEGEQYASAETIDEEDIIEYLIYTGVSAATIELSK